MSYLFWHYADVVNELGFIDARYCPNCKRVELHDALRHHKHFVLGIIPFYWSNKFYSICSHCKHTILHKGDERKHIKKLNSNAVKFFKYTEQLNSFILDVTEICKKNEVIVFGEINHKNLETAVYETMNKYNFIHKEKYDLSFYQNMVLACSESLLRISYEQQPKIENNNSVENKLLQLKELYEKHLITEQEYQTKRQELLNDL